MSSGAWAPRSASDRRRSRRGRVGPVQVLEDQHDRLVTRSREIPRRHRGELPSPQFLRREFRRPLFGQWNIHKWRDQGRVFVRVEANQT